jgi:hypothetical protein
MAEYYSVLRKAIGSLDANSGDARRTVYDKARNALIGQLKAVDPPLTTAEISRQRLELEEAIRKVEREAASAPPPLPRTPGRPAAPSARAAAPAPRAAAPTPRAASPALPVAARMAPGPVADEPPLDTGPSAQDIFRRAIQDAESRGSAAGAAAGAAIERAAIQMRAEANQVNGAPAELKPPRERIDRAPPPPEQDEPHDDYDRRGDGRGRASPEPRLAPEYGQEWEPREPRDSREQSQPAAQQPTPFVDRRDRPNLSQGRRRGYLEEDDQQAFEREARPSRLPSVVLFVLIVAVLGGVGALAWSQRAVIRPVVSDLLGLFDGKGAARKPAAPAAAGGVTPAGKDTDRLIAGASAPAAKDVRSVDPAPADQSGAGLPDAGDSASAAAAPADTAAPADAAPAVAATDASGEALVAQKAILYEEPLDAAGAAAGVNAINAAVTWKYVADGANGPEIEASLQVPERGMKVQFSIHKNSDATLPASHLIEVVVDTPADFPGKAIKSVPRIVMKPTEEARGQPLVGAPAKVTDGFFWIALSATDADIAANLALLRERNWIDLPLVYETGQRAILTFEKGTPGEQVFEKAVAAWGAG